MKKLIYLFVLALFSTTAYSQLKLPPSGANQKSYVKQYMGAHAYVSIVYNSPDVTGPRGEDRTGQIWGQLVPYGLTNLNFGISSDENPSPWRAGANENTVIYFSHDVNIEGKPLKAGKYGLHMITRENEDWTVIFSKNYGAWGSYFYKESEDALRVDVSTKKSEFHEWLTYEFTDRQENACTVSMNWENISVPIRVELQDPTAIYVDYLRNEMQNSNGFNWVQRDAAANYCLQNDVNIEEAYQWQLATTTNGNFIGNENITTLSTLAGLQTKLGKKEEAIQTFKRAASHPTATVFNIHGLGRQLIAMGNTETAMEIFKKNVEIHGDTWPTNVGMARGLSALGKYEKALHYAKLAYEQAPDKLNKDGLASSIEKLKNNEDMN